MISRDEAALVVVDVQQGFSGYSCFDRVARQSGKLVAAAEILALPVIATEQYPKGLGPTVPEVGLPEDLTPIAKTVFSACRADGFNLHGRRQVMVCGIEAHVCVAQTALDLIEQGCEVHLVSDAVGSRHKADRKVALRRLSAAGCVETTVEAVLLELCREAGTPKFKAIQKLII